MGLYNVRSDIHAAGISRTSALPVAGSTPTHDAPTFPHLPSTVFVVVATTGTFIWTDVFGVSNTITLPTGAFELPFTMATIEVGTAIGSVTLAWNPSP